MKKRIPITLVFLGFLLVFLINAAYAQEISLDIKTDKQTYSAGENLSYQVVLLKDNVPASDNVNVVISDNLGKQSFNYNINSNTWTNLKIEKEFASGYWKIEASYQGKSVKRFFSIGEREEVEFSIVDDKLVIRNVGNVPYTKTIQILIGDKVISQKQDLDVGKTKEILLVAPDGQYNVQVTDGVSSITKQDVHLTGTGKVIGALDEQLAESQPVLGGARDVNGDSIFSSSNFSVALIFIGAVFGLFVLILVEKVMRKKRAAKAKDAFV